MTPLRGWERKRSDVSEGHGWRNRLIPRVQWTRQVKDSVRIRSVEKYASDSPKGRRSDGVLCKEWRCETHIVCKLG